MRWIRTFPAVIPILTFVSGCGGLPEPYGEALKTASGPAAVYCSTGGESTVAGVVSITNPGGMPLELRSVEFPDASPQPTEVYGVSIPTDETIGFGTSSLVDPGAGSPVLTTAWQGRSTLPIAVPPGSTGELLVVLHPPTNPDAANYVHEVELTVAVGDDTDSAKFKSLRMTGTEMACEATSARFQSDG